MAVAVKNPPIAGMSSPFDRLPVVSLVGAAYVAVCLGIVLAAVPYLWRMLTGLTDVGGAILLGLVMLAVATGLAVFGARLFGTSRPLGARAGIFTALVGFVIVLLLARWASLWLEYWIYGNHGLGDSATVGLTITAVIAAVLLAGEAYLFFRPRMEGFLVGFEKQGWFTATSYKGQQGQRVRRGTILGILLIGGSGVYTMINNGFLHRLPESLYLNIPFTGTAPVKNVGDAGMLLADKSVPKDQVEIVSHGASGFKDGAVVSAKEFKDKLVDGVQKAADLDSQTKERLAKEIQDDDLTGLLSLPGPSEAAVAAFGPTALGVVPPSGLPTALLRLDPFVLRDLNDRLRREYVLVAAPKDAQKLNWQNLTDMPVGTVVPRTKFDEQVKGLTDDQKPIADRPYAAASPGVVNDRLTLLPALQYTLPLLLIALTLWVAWRIVNYPVFADFLIATEAELNKVSWISRRRLVQDTIVVLITTFLLALFLFLMDQTWRVILSWKPIGVLQIDNDKVDKSAENKMW